MYQTQEDPCDPLPVDGSMNATEKYFKLAWLKAEPGANTCRILSNVRCLFEGVDGLAPLHACPKVTCPVSSDHA